MFNPIDQMSVSPPAESLEKGNKRFTVADVLRLVSIKKQKAFDDTCGGVDQTHQTAVDRNRFDTMKQKYRKTKKIPKHCVEKREMPPSRPPLPPLPCGSKLVYMGNLSPSIKESDVLEFFKDIGKVDWVKFMVDDIGFLGFGHVRFETYEAGRKALEHNGEQLLDRRVKLLAAEERTIFDTVTPSREYILSRTPSIEKLRGYGMGGGWPGHGPTLGPSCCKCTHPRNGADRGRGYGADRGLGYRAGRGRGFGAGRGRGYWDDRGRGSCHM